MELPGKYCIGLIEEDNPQKSYFRFMPLILAEQDGYRPVDMRDQLPENGCIRIVPDKNESSRFKARMRRVGRYCAVDLREHPEENDKIRPNKNYHGDETETNAFIIYSDVVRELPENVLAEILEVSAPEDAAQLALSIPTPGTARVVLEGCVPFGVLWKYAPMENLEQGVALTRTEEIAAPEDFQRFEVAGFDGQTHCFLAARPGRALYPLPEPAAAAPEAPRQEAQPQSAPARTAYPWLHHDASIAPAPVDPRLSPREQTRAMQSGINPRRGRSLQEIIDEKWRHSRLDQLGHPVSEAYGGQPVVSPVDRAYDAVSAAWEHTAARPGLAQVLSRIDGLGQAIAQDADRRLAENREKALAEFRAQRDQLNAEIAAAQENREKTLSDMQAELRQRNAQELAHQEEKVAQAQETLAQLDQRAAQAREIARDAEQAVARLTDETLTARLSEYAVNSRAADILMELGASRRSPAAPRKLPTPIHDITVHNLAKRVCDYFAQAGCPVHTDEAVNLLACLCLGDTLLITGPSGCGKTLYARLLAESLGLKAAGRLARYPLRARADQEYQPEFCADAKEFPGVVFADDINSLPGACARLVADVEPLKGVKMVITAQDAPYGLPLDARLLDRAYTLRLQAESAASPWERPYGKRPQVDDCVTTQALEKLFTPDARNIASAVKDRLAEIRSALERYGVLLSRRTLDALWLYCASVTPYLSVSSLEAFDLAFAQRALMSVLAVAGVDALHALPGILEGMPRSLALLKQPLAIEL